MSWLPDPELILRAIFTASLQASVLAIAVFLILRSLGRWISFTWRVVLWAIPVLRLVVVVLPVTHFGPFQHPDALEASQPAMLSPIPITTDLAIDRIETSLMGALSATAATTSATPGRIEANMDPHESRSAFQMESIGGPVLVLWIFGGACLLTHWFRASTSLRRILARGQVVEDGVIWSLLEAARDRARVSRRVQLVLTDEAMGPATCGWLRPKVILSRRLARELTLGDLQIVIAHEVEHIRRGDCLLLTLGHVAVVLHWFNPLAYFIRRSLQREIELAVDFSTLGRLGPSKARDYGELLLRVVDSARPAVGIVAMASPGVHLRRRVAALMCWHRPHWYQSLLGGILACLLTLAGLSTGGDDRSAAAQEQSRSNGSSAVTSDRANGQNANEQNGHDEPNSGIATKEPETRAASGRVVDPAGTPLAGARLFSEVYFEDGTSQGIAATANDRGEFSISYPANPYSYRTDHTWVYAPGWSVRVVNMAKAFADGTADNVEIRLPPIESKEIEVRLPDGSPCVGATVRPRYVAVPNGVFAADEPTGLSNLLPKEMKPLLSSTTDANGRAKINSIPLALLNSIEVETQDHGTQNFRRLSDRFDEPLRLASTGSIHGRLKAKSPQDFEGTKVYVSTDFLESHEGLAQTVLDATGRFHVPAIASGRLLLHLSWDEAADVHPFTTDRLQVSAGETLELVIDTRPTIPVTGRIVTADTGEPVAGARISHRYPSQGSIRIPNYVETDEQGRYKTRLAAGEVRRQVFSGVRPPYEYPELDPIIVPEDAKTFEVADILIHPKRLVTGKLVDTAGSPIADTTVVLRTGSYRHVAGMAETKADGSFEMRVRDWDHFSSTWQSRWYWATLDRPAVNTDPPEFTRLKLLDENPDALLLQRP